MNRNIKALLWLVVAAVVLAPVVASATPNATSAVIRTRIFNDCPLSILTTGNSYPFSIRIDDANPGTCFGFANLHNWRFSTDGVNPAVFNNGDAFKLCAVLTLTGTGDGEGGLQVSPWWSQDVDGRLNVRTTDGEIACFGGRLPFYSFTATYGLHYLKGTSIYLEMVYIPNDLTQANPATMTYTVIYNSTTYTSGPLAFDEGNPAENPPYGLWGMLNDGRVGGHLQYFLSSVPPPSDIHALWEHICYSTLDATPTESTTWGAVKALYR